MPYLDGHDRRLLKELRPERESFAPPVNQKLVNALAFFATCAFLFFYWT